MKNNLMKSALVVGTVLLSGVSIAQKKNETTAAVAYKNTFMTAMGNQDLVAAKKALIDAKKFIDLAAENPETKESPKTLMLKGSIYSSFLMVGMQSMDTSFIKLAGEDALEVAIENYKKAFSMSDKFDEEITDAVVERYNLLDGLSLMMYKSENYKDAAEMYSTQARMYEAINKVDSNSIFNSALCFAKAGDDLNAAKKFESLAKIGYKGSENYVSASYSYRKAGAIDDAKRIVGEGRTKFPLDKDLLLESVNICLDAKDIVGAEAVLTQAIASDPKNKILHLQIGLVYGDLKQPVKAEQAFNNALAIDPNYEDALHQLGAQYINTAIDLSTEMNALKYTDPKVKILDQQATENYTKALVPLEKYLTLQPNEKDVLLTLSQVYRKLGNIEKAAEYKKRIEALK